ncbi:hypothetical protein ACIBJI_21045 [Nocardia sp. NPDC050408]|uniref:hypothetical protein n=1 Tax=Nocardia sp. NPDC050408 TaxID=3364319 RepID=UPI00379AE724
MAEDSVVAERGVAIADDAVWAVAVRQARVIGLLAASGRVGGQAADRAAAELGISGGRCMCWSHGGGPGRGWCRICCRASRVAAGAGND